MSTRLYTREQREQHFLTWNTSPTGFLHEHDLLCSDMKTADILGHPAVEEVFAYRRWHERLQPAEYGYIQQSDCAFHMAERPVSGFTTEWDGYIVSRSLEHVMGDDGDEHIDVELIAVGSGLDHDDSDWAHQTLVRWLDGVEYGEPEPDVDDNGDIIRDNDWEL